MKPVSLRVALLTAVGVTMVAGCGGSSQSPHGKARGSSPRPSCGTYCVQAGLPAGQSAPGYPCPQSGCLNCPPGGCMTLLSRDAAASGGVVGVSLRCNLTSTCRGALLLCFPFALCGAGGTKNGGGGRLAASDFAIPAGHSASAPIALTRLGQQVARLQGGYEADVIVDVANYGIVNAHVAGSRSSATSMSHAGLLLTSNDQGPGIPGATRSCGGAPPVFAGSNASCALARTVFKAWEQGNRPAQVTAVNPVTRKRYALRCVGSGPVVCSGDNAASVAFFE